MAVINPKYRFLWLIAALLLLIGATVGYRLLPLFYGPVMSLGVSDDGRWVISSHKSNHLVLWNLSEQDHRVVSDNANIYSAYFIPGRHTFLWQDLDDTVYMQGLDDEVQKTFEHFPTYGHAIDYDLQHYLSSNENWNLFHGYGDSLTPVLRDSKSPSLTGTGKLLNLSLSENGYFVTAGRGLRKADKRPINKETPTVRDPDELRFSSNFGGVVLWSYETLKPVAKLAGNSVKTHATISPDGQWVVSGDENGIGLYWNTDEPEKRYRQASYGSGIFIPGPTDDPADASFDDSELIEAPQGVNTFTIAVAFIHNSEYYLRFGNNSHIAALFKTGSPWPVKYFDLGESPQLVTYGSQYSRNTAIATSPEAGILVMGHRSGGGISVYKFDPGALTLERTWVAE